MRIGIAQLGVTCFVFGILAREHAKLERRATPDAPQLVQPRFNPIGKAVFRSSLGLVIERHFGQTRKRPDIEEFIPIFVFFFEIAHSAYSLRQRYLCRMPCLWYPDVKKINSRHKSMKVYQI